MNSAWSEYANILAAAMSNSVLDPKDIMYVSEMLAAIRFFLGNLENIPIEEREPLALRLHIAEGSLESLAQKIKQHYPADSFVARKWASTEVNSTRKQFGNG
ncbi:MAG: hypothetical protein AAGL97_16265 [Pseudomonadota bacterium]